jgi:hypothetical protein
MFLFFLSFPLTVLFSLPLTYFPSPLPSSVPSTSGQLSSSRTYSFSKNPSPTSSHTALPSLTGITLVLHLHLTLPLLVSLFLALSRSSLTPLPSLLSLLFPLFLVFIHVVFYPTELLHVGTLHAQMTKIPALLKRASTKGAHTNHSFAMIWRFAQ